MTTDIEDLKAKLRRWTLIPGVLQITVGCLVEFIAPSAVTWFRGIVMAHIEFTANGILIIIIFQSGRHPGFHISVTNNI